MTSHIFGLGLGLVIILSVWILAIFIFIISLRVEKSVGALALTLAAIITFILVSIPRAPQYPVIQEDKPYDPLFVWRLGLLIVLLISCVIGLVGYIKFGLMDTVRSQRIKNWVL